MCAFAGEALRTARDRAAEIERQLAGAVEEREAQRQIALHLKRELCLMMESVEACASCPGEGALSCAACPRRVLIVGGMNRMEPLYLQLVENSGNIFDYHDGYLSGGAMKLERRLQRQGKRVPYRGSIR